MSCAGVDDGKVKLEITVGALVFFYSNIEAVFDIRNLHSWFGGDGQLSHADESSKAFLHVLVPCVHDICTLAVEQVGLGKAKAFPVFVSTVAMAGNVWRRIQLGEDWHAKVEAQGNHELFIAEGQAWLGWVSAKPEG